MSIKPLSPTTENHAEAVRLTEAGISVRLPDENGRASWKTFQQPHPTPAELRRMFAKEHAIARVHGNLETLYFDLPRSPIYLGRAAHNG